MSKTPVRPVHRPALLAGLTAATLLSLTDLHGQGITTAAIRGTVQMADGSDPDGGRVVVRNSASGFVVEADVRRGRFLVQGLELGGPYSITVRRIGAVAWQWDGVFLTLGEPLDLRVTLEPASVLLDSIVIVTAAALPLCRRHGGTATTLDDSLLHRLPSLNRDVYDFLRLVPQISTRIGFATGGISGGGAGFRFNHFMTNGVPERSLGGGQPPEFAGGKSLPFEAVREYQVLLAPFDVRYGDFAGAMVNTVTRSGTNRFGGSVFAQGRGDEIARGGDLATLPYQRWQYGASLSGPIVRDRVQFFAAAEFQDLTSPMVGPYVGQPAGAPSPVPVSNADLNRLSGILGQYGLEAGSGGPVSSRNEIRNLFIRLDAVLPKWDSRAVLWLNDSDTRSLTFSRLASPDTFPLSSTEAPTEFGTRTVALQLYTTPHSAGVHNELTLSHRSVPFRAVPDARQPIVRVTVPATLGGGTTLVTGPPAQAHAGAMNGSSVNLREELTLPAGASHVANVGLEAEWFRIGAPGVRNAFGTWTFQSLDSLEAGLAERYEVARDFGSARVPISGQQFAAFAGNRWQTSRRFSLTFGLRAEMLGVDQQAPYNPMVDSLFGRRTDATFRRRIHLSPRVGFTWDLSSAARDQLRGGLGVFTGRPPLAWLHIPLQNYGDGLGTLRCGSLPGDLGLPPPFSPDPDHPPLTCAGGEGLSGPPRGDVELIDPDLRMAQALRGVLAYERRLPGDVVGTVEALVTRNLSDFAFVNLNLAGPVATDRRGRVLYGSIDSLGRARPSRITDSLPSVIELRNVSRNYSVQLAASLAKRFDHGVSVMASYTWSRVRDTQTPLRINNRGLVNWASRAVSGYHNDLTPGISLNDVPHRVTLAGTWRAPWDRWTTELSFLYVGESGSPFTWLTGGVGGRGDLNADGALNDPVYVPRSARDPDEIVFTGVSTEPGADNSPAAQAARIQAQQAAFDRFIARTPCLREHRGRIIPRNSCREPWSHTTVASLRQTIPVGGGALETQLDVFNLLNLLDGDWGLRRVVANPALLEHVGQSLGPSGQRDPVFRFASSSAGWVIEPAESAFQLQFGVRYRF